MSQTAAGRPPAAGDAAEESTSQRLFGVAKVYNLFIGFIGRKLTGPIANVYGMGSNADRFVVKPSIRLLRNDLRSLQGQDFSRDSLVQSLPHLYPLNPDPNKQQIFPKLKRILGFSLPRRRIQHGLWVNNFRCTSISLHRQLAMSSLRSGPQPGVRTRMLTFLVLCGRI